MKALNTMIFASLLALMPLLQVQAQEVWSLEKCIQHALNNNLDIQQSEIAISQAAINEKQAKHARYPSLNGSTGLSLNFGRTVDPTNNDFVSARFLSNNLSLNSNVILYNAGQINNSIAQAKINKESAEKSHMQRERDVSLAVAQAYINVLFAQENLSNNSNQLNLTNEQYNQLKALVDAGVRAENELLDIEAQIATAEQNLITQENNITLALLNLKQLLMLEPEFDMTTSVPDQLDVENIDLTSTFAETYQSAEINQASIRAAELDVESAKLGEKIARASMYPTVTLGGNLGTNYSNQGKRIVGYETKTQTQTVIINNIETQIETQFQSPITENTPYFDQLDGNLSYGLGLGVNVPIYNNYRSKAAIERAKLNIVNSELLVERQKNQLKTNVQQALADLQAASKRYAAATKSQNAQQRAFENAQRRFDLGSLNSFDMVNARNLYDNAQTNLLIAKYDYIFKSKIVDFYMGRPITL